MPNFILITGALGFLGKRFCKHLTSKGYKVIATDISPSPLMQQNQGEFFHDYIQADLSIPSEIDDLILSSRKLGYEYYGLINNGAINDIYRKSETLANGILRCHESYDDFLNVLKVNVGSIYQLCNTIGYDMATRGQGKIINVASTYGVSAPDQNIYIGKNGERNFVKGASYPSSKAAVIMLTKYFGTMWAAEGVQINCLCPGGVENGQSQTFIDNYSQRCPAKRMASAEDYFSILEYLLDSRSTYMCGSTITVDGGWTAI